MLCDPMDFEYGLRELWSVRLGDSCKSSSGLLAEKEKKSVGKEGLLEDKGQAARNAEAGGCWSEPHGARARSKGKRKKFNLISFAFLFSFSW